MENMMETLDMQAVRHSPSHPPAFSIETLIREWNIFGLIN